MTPDRSEIETVENRMINATKKLNAMAQALGLAKQVVEYDSDRRRQLLSKHMMSALKRGDSAAAADAEARANEAYGQELDALAEQYKDAQTVIATFRATEASFEASRSLLSMQKETLKTLEV